MNYHFSIFFTTIFMFGNVLLFSQESASTDDPSVWEKVDQVYNRKGYMVSATKYQLNQSSDDMNANVLSKIANSYRLNGKYDLAEYWYTKYIQDDSKTEDLLFYAEVLQTNGKCNDAIKWYNAYAKKSGSNQDFISDCEEINNFKTHKDFEIENVKELNTPYLDFCAMEHNGGVLFTSTRRKRGLFKITDSWSKSNFSDIFFAEKKEDGKFKSVTSVSGSINQKYHDGVTSISEEGSVMYFSRNNSSGKGDDGLVDLKIYQAILVNGKWKNVEELPINGDDFTSCHPSISSDGTHLYFASNRPEGYGGMDIYVSHNVNGTWQKPVNLGPTVNTSRNEVFPFINKAGQLYFSSNGHKGFGGLDIFYVEKNGDDWDTRKNLGSPFNTKKDDFGFYANPQMTAGYLTSNRVGGKGGDDIYSWKSISEDGLDLKETKEVDIQFINSKKNLNHSNTTVTIEDKLGKNNPAKLKTNGRGMITTMIDPSQTYKVLFEKNGYNPVEREIPGRDLADGIVDISFEKIKCLELFGTVMNGKYNNTIANTTLTITNKCTGETTTIKSKEDGSFDFCLDNGCDFDIVANKTNFSEATSKISTTNPNNWSSDNFKITLNPINKPAKTTLTSHSENTHQVRKHFLGSETSTFKVGQVLTLKNIYYDYNKSNIRPDAATELDYVVAMMKEFPNMQITLSSHTDSRGDYNYNRALSQKRATQARNYIISRGIDAYRITSSGQGESILKNNCRDAVNCSEAEHQINRRTEILINKVD